MRFRGGKALVFGGPMVTGGGSVGPLPPSGVGSGVFWLSASSGVSTSGATVTGWTDQIGGKTATIVGSAPTYDATGLGGEFPGVTFSGGRLTYSIGATLSGATSYAVIMVYQDTATATNAYYLFEYGTNGALNVGEFAVLPNFSADNNLVHFSPGSAGANRFSSDADTAPMTNVGMATFACDFTRSSHEIAAVRLNGADLAGTWNTDTDSSGSTLASATLTVGGSNGGGPVPWPGTIGEFAILKNPTSADIAAVEAYFQ